MPMVKIVKPLSKLCIECITRNLEISYCGAKLNVGNERDFVQIPKISSKSFHQLPEVVLAEIFQHLWQVKEPLYIKLLPELIMNASYLRSLWLYPYFKEFLYSIPKFGKLQTLEMSCTKVGDDCLKLVGTYCRNLRVLNVCACKRVTDVGIRWLCVDDQTEIADKRTGQCKAITKLNVNSTKVTKKGIKIALENLPDLSAIFHDINIFQVLVQLTQNALDQKQKCVPFSLSRIIVSGIFLSSCLRKGHFGLSSTMFPLLFKVDMVLEKGLKDIDLQCLTSLKMLREINFRRKKGEERAVMGITFEGGVAKLLKVIGSSLEKLAISCFDVVNILTVIEFCPNLNFLAIHHDLESGNRELSEDEANQFRIEWNEKNKKQILKHLAVLHCGFAIPSDLLLWILSFPSLVDARLFYCDSLTDDLIQNIVKVNGFQNLKILALIRCHSVTGKGIDAIMKDGNFLEELFFAYCNQITLENVTNWHKLAGQKNWKLYMYFIDSITNVATEFGR